MNALRLAQEKSIREEDFERAAQLRDQIRQLEEMYKEAEASEKDGKESK